MRMLVFGIVNLLTTMYEHLICARFLQSIDCGHRFICDTLHRRLASRMNDVAFHWARWAQNGANLGLFKVSFLLIWLLGEPDLFHFGPI